MVALTWLTGCSGGETKWGTVEVPCSLVIDTGP